MSWEEEQLRVRLHRFHPTPDSDGLAVSINVRPLGGCSCREHCCPDAYSIIDAARRIYERETGFEFVEHETGPEILLFCAMAGAAAAGVSLAKEVVGLVTAVINAFTAGRRPGDKRHGPIELTVRGFDKDGKLFVERVLRVDAGDEVGCEVIQKALVASLQKQLPAPKATGSATSAKRRKTSKKHGSRA